MHIAHITNTYFTGFVYTDLAEPRRMPHELKRCCYFYVQAHKFAQKHTYLFIYIWKRHCRLETSGFNKQEIQCRGTSLNITKCTSHIHTYRYEICTMHIVITMGWQLATNLVNSNLTSKKFKQFSYYCLPNDFTFHTLICAHLWFWSLWHIMALAEPSLLCVLNFQRNNTNNIGYSITDIYLSLCVCAQAHTRHQFNIKHSI